MKTKLKTLEDLEVCSIISCTTNFHQKGVSSEILKKEVVKWLGKERTLRMNAQDFIAVFFDITEENLK